MVQLIFFCLAAFGMAMTVTKSKLFKPLRAMAKNSFLCALLNCPWCFGTWAGFLVRFLMMIWLRDPIAFWWVDIIDIFLHGCVAGIVSFFGYMFYLKLGGDKL